MKATYAEVRILFLPLFRSILTNGIFQIYNEQLRDLLLPESTPPNERNTITIREDAKGRIILTGLRQVPINSFDDLLAALNFGSSIRQTDSTAVNAKSSRSHAIFSLNLVQRKSSSPPGSLSAKEKRMSLPVDGPFGSESPTPTATPSSSSITVDSKLHFVDLAGSERMKNTGLSGERAKEGISINAGLASLGKVIAQLSSRQAGAHVSYRDSKLTRLLQDSLGGNAITYMIACVTPAEFHLSETLNTVQYAQRARAIQSKPRIQQVTDDAATVDHLKAEVAFLRQKMSNIINSAESGNERPQQQGSRDIIRLQNQLLDIQESYNALSQRHTRLISGLTRDSDDGQQVEGEGEGEGDGEASSSIERLKRSHSFAESVDQVVLEYEKTIQALESALSDTRFSLSSTESELLERETRCTYVDTVNSQLQARVQKALDREANAELYLRELEARLDGQSSGEEKQAAIVSELRREINRARETETNSEEYISTLEERLADADQDIELMRREMGRMEHIIERQRSVGKLDGLLHGLDSSMQQANKKNGLVNGVHHDVHENHNNDDDDNDDDNSNEADDGAANNSSNNLVVDRSGSADRSFRSGRSSTSLHVLSEASENEDDLGESFYEAEEEVATPVAAAPLTVSGEEANKNGETNNTAQSNFVADKLETVSQELFDLRLQHETTVNDYDLLESKYEDALKALAELRQDVTDEARHPASTAEKNLSDESPQKASFLEVGGKARSQNHLHHGTQPEFSRSLSSELSLAGEQAPSQEEEEEEEEEDEEEETMADGVTPKANGDNDDDVEHMRKLLDEHRQGSDEMSRKYSELQVERDELIGLVERMKLDIQKSTMASSPPATPSGYKPVFRRMTTQNPLSASSSSPATSVAAVERAHRSLSALRNLASEEFAEGRPDVLQSFEMHLDAASHELHSRLDRIHALETEAANFRKEMEMKSTIISGLARERSSLQGASPVDMGIVSQLRDQIVQQEIQQNQLKGSHCKREKQLLAEVDSLSGLVKSHEANAVNAQAAVSVYEEKEKELLTEIAKLHTVINHHHHSRSSSLRDPEYAEEAAAATTAATVNGGGQGQGQTIIDDEEKTRLRSQVAHLHTLVGTHEAAGRGHASAADEYEKGIRHLEEELSTWKAKHGERVSELQSTKVELSAAVADLDAMCAERNNNAAKESSTTTTTTRTMDVADDRELREKVIQNLQQEVEEHKAAIAEHLDMLNVLDDSRVVAERELARHLEQQQQEKPNGVASSAVHHQHLRIAELEREIGEHKANVQDREAHITSLQEMHKREQEELRVGALKSSMAESKQSAAELLQTVSGILHTEVTSSTLADQLQDLVSQNQRLSESYAQLDRSRRQVGEMEEEDDDDSSREELARLLRSVSGIFSSEVTTATLADQIRDVMVQKESFSRKYTELTNANRELQRQAQSDQDTRVETLSKKVTEQDGKVKQLAESAASAEASLRRKEEESQKKDAMIEDITAEKQKNARLVEELEEQITNSFDQHHNRLSVLQHERERALEDASVRIATYEKDIEMSRSRIEQLEVSDIYIQHGNHEGVFADYIAYRHKSKTKIPTRMIAAAPLATRSCPTPAKAHPWHPSRHHRPRSHYHRYLLSPRQRAMPEARLPRRDTPARRSSILIISSRTTKAACA